MKRIIVFGLACAVLLLIGCALTPPVKSPFFDQSAEWQVEGASAAVDIDRVFAVRQAALRYVSAGGNPERLLRLADGLEVLTNGDWTGNAVDRVLGDWTSGLAPEDAELLSYFRAKAFVQYDAWIDLPLSPEKQRVIGVYVSAIRDALTE